LGIGKHIVETSEPFFFPSSGSTVSIWRGCDIGSFVAERRRAAGPNAVKNYRKKESNVSEYKKSRLENALTECRNFENLDWFSAIH
jgi:hypothetical protein